MAPAEPLTFMSKESPYVCVMVSRDGTLHLLLSPDSPLAEKLIDPGVVGIRVGLLPDCLVVGRPRQTYIDVRCDSQQFSGPFTVVIRQVALAILRDGKPPSVAVNSVLRLWRRFWIRQPTGALSEAEQLGLLAELMMLQALIEAGVQNAVLAWTGPLGGEHDFELPGIALEVKSTLGNQRRHLINGLHQLEMTSGRALLVVSTLALRGEGGVALSGTAALLLNMIDTPEEQEGYLDRLAAAGYSPAHDDEYAISLFIMGEPVVFHVDEGFPKITPESLTKPISPRIDAVRYSVDLDGLPHFGMQSQDFVKLLRSGSDEQHSGV